ncbi:MAG: SAM-dependent methyltransferase [Pseudomonadota bacterium]
MLLNHPCQAIYIADPNYLTELCEEVGGQYTVLGNMVFSDQIKHDICFARDVWLNPVITEFSSISTAARLLRAHGKFWFLNPFENIRRARLIQEELRKLPPLTQTFPILTPLPAIQGFSLLDKNTLVYATKRWKNPPLGDFQFVEDRQNPPNRAYLKLWEALSLWGTYPTATETALDLGASPGGWTYVMQSFGTRVIAVDKAPLAPHIAKQANVEFLQQSAFALDPDSFEQPVDWLLSDIACYPERAYELASRWISANKAKKMIITIKLQGETDFATLAKFQAIPHSRIIHLFYNKHEATFFYPAPEHLWI